MRYEAMRLDLMSSVCSSYMNEEALIKSLLASNFCVRGGYSLD